jgi:Toprim domain
MPLVARKPSQDLVDLVGTLGGTWHGYTAMCRCPAHADTEPSLSLRQGDHGILVTCFAGCDREDVLRELGRIRPGQHFPAPAASIAAGTANVERLWNEALPVQGSPAERYLARRHLPATLPDTRFHPRCPHGPKPLTRFKPALLVAVRQSHHLVALQRIFLTSDHWYEAKVMLGRPGQGAWQGGPAGATLAIGEGFETAAAFMQLHDTPCWASLGARRLDQLALPDGLQTLIIAEDDDPEGRQAARRAWARYRRDGLVLRRKPPPGRAGDWAEALEQRG